jgi:hypothetical protein
MFLTTITFTLACLLMHSEARFLDRNSFDKDLLSTWMPSVVTGVILGFIAFRIKAKVRLRAVLQLSPS